MKLADALLRRKELNDKVAQLKTIKDKDVYEMKFQRKPVNESTDDLVAQVPKITISQVTEEYDYYANKLRLIDGAIQNLNWTTEIVVDDRVWVDFTDSKKK